MATRRQLLRLGVALVTLSAVLLAACVETKEVIKEVPVEKVVYKEIPVERVVTQQVERVVRVEVPVERVVVKEVPVEKVVIQQVEKIVRVEVPVEKVVVKEVPVEKVVTKEAAEVVEKIADDEICETERVGTVERAVNREYPSVFGAWSHVLLNLPIPDEIWELEYVEQMRAYHDLFLAGMGHGLQWSSTPNGMRVVGAWQIAEEQKNRLLAENPNYLHIVPIYHYGAHPELYPEDWPYWLRDESGNRVADEGWGELVVDYTHPAAQDHFVQQAIAVAKCGVFDGIFLDWWEQDEYFNQEIANLYHGNRIDAKISMLRRIRAAVGDDFLIIVNSRIQKIPRSAPYVSGAFMEGAHRHTRKYLTEVESTLLWAEEHFRYPQVNSLQGWSVPTEPLDSPRNRQWMRIFTTLSLTHSDGYVSYVTGFSVVEEYANSDVQDKYWHAFWDADLGHPVGGKGQLYENREGLFIREFTNGWAVYNHSGQAQQIELPVETTGVHSGVAGTRHTLPDLDGEIYIKGG